MEVLVSRGTAIVMEVFMSRRTVKHSGDDENGADAFSIATFCRRNAISESFYHKLQQQGLGPRILRLGTRTLITREAAAAWRREREAETAAINPT